MPTRTKEEWEAKKRNDEIEKQEVENGNSKLQEQLDIEVARAKEMKGAKFKKERQAVYAAIGRLKALLAGQEVRDKDGTGNKTKLQTEERWEPLWDTDQIEWIDQSWEDQGSIWYGGGATVGPKRNSWDDKDWKETKISKHSRPEEADSTGPSALVLVSGLSADADEGYLRAMFERHGTVRKISAPTREGSWKRRKQSRGFAFVELSAGAAARAVEAILQGAADYSIPLYEQGLSAKVVPPRTKEEWETLQKKRNDDYVNNDCLEK